MNDDGCPVDMEMTSHTKHACNAKEGLQRWGSDDCKCVPEWLYVRRLSEAVHDHSLDSMDATKRSDALQCLCKMTMEGNHWSGTAVVEWLKQEYPSQVKYVKRADVFNSARGWRAANAHVDLEVAVPQHEQALTKDAMEAMLLAGPTKFPYIIAELFAKLPETRDLVL